ncbi:MAG: hypothetical protein U5R49_12115 [Deltaproteobacteria bacterium]|nr:hypothetical protein [Deltaproteobacteria bacterium]
MGIRKDDLGSKRINNHTTTSIAISASTIDIPSASMATTSTSIPEYIMTQPKERRNLEATKLLLEKDKSLKGFEKELPQILDDLIEGKTGSHISKGKKKVYVFNNCSFYGSAVAGGDVHSVDISFVQEWNALQNTVDIETLKSELVLLRNELSKRAKTDDHFEAAAQVSMALEDLNKANGPSMLKRLRNCGSWVLGAARDIGVSVLTAIIIGG